jgi:hypothetical protein
MAKRGTFCWRDRFRSTVTKNTELPFCELQQPAILDGGPAHLRHRANQWPDSSRANRRSIHSSFADYEIIYRWGSHDPSNKEKDNDGNEVNKSRTLPNGVKLNLRH